MLTNDHANERHKAVSADRCFFRRYPHPAAVPYEGLELANVRILQTKYCRAW